MLAGLPVDRNCTQAGKEREGRAGREGSSITAQSLLRLFTSTVAGWCVWRASPSVRLPILTPPFVLRPTVPHLVEGRGGERGGTAKVHRYSLALPPPALIAG